MKRIQLFMALSLISASCAFAAEVSSVDALDAVKARSLLAMRRDLAEEVAFKIFKERDVRRESMDLLVRISPSLFTPRILNNALVRLKSTTTTREFCMRLLAPSMMECIQDEAVLESILREIVEITPNVARDVLESHIDFLSEDPLKGKWGQFETKLRFIAQNDVKRTSFLRFFDLFFPKIYDPYDMRCYGKTVIEALPDLKPKIVRVLGEYIKTSTPLRSFIHAESLFKLQEEYETFLQAREDFVSAPYFLNVLTPIFFEMETKDPLYIPQLKERLKTTEEFDDALMCARKIIKISQDEKEETLKLLVQRVYDVGHISKHPLSGAGLLMHSILHNYSESPDVEDLLQRSIEVLLQRIEDHSRTKDTSPQADQIAALTYAMSCIFEFSKGRCHLPRLLELFKCKIEHFDPDLRSMFFMSRHYSSYFYREMDRNITSEERTFNKVVLDQLNAIKLSIQ